MVYCHNCGAENRPDNEHCLECGVALHEEPEESDPWEGRLISQRFKVIRKLGDGGMGEVYEAVQHPIGRRVAVKILSEEMAEKPQQVERFRREAQSASLLTSPHTIVIHDFGQDDDGTLFIAMELLEGESLAECLDRDSTMSPEDIVTVLTQVTESLHEAHEQGVVHRDLKPENIFLTHRANNPLFTVVLDFGIAKLSNDIDGHTIERLTRQGAICGTPHYMAPEQIRDDVIDWRADIYALGILLYRLLCGIEPFDASKVVDLLTMHLNESPPPIEWAEGDGSPAQRALERVALRALSKDRNKRHQSAFEFAEDLRSCLELSSTVTDTARWASASNSLFPPSKTLIKWSAIAAVSIGIFLFIVFDRGASTQHVENGITTSQSKTKPTVPIGPDSPKSTDKPTHQERRGSTSSEAKKEQKEDLVAKAKRLQALRAEVDRQLNEARRKAAEASKSVDEIQREIDNLSKGFEEQQSPQEEGEVGYLKIRCETAGVRVSVGGQVVGTTPISDPVTLPAGEHIVSGTDGARKTSAKVRIEAQATSSLNLEW